MLAPLLYRRLWDLRASDERVVASGGRSWRPDWFMYQERSHKSAWMHLNLTWGDRLLDAGCGGGEFARRAAHVCREVVGVDASLRMARRAEELCADLRNVTIASAEVSALPFPDASFDKICCNSVFLYLGTFAAAERALAELRRVAKPGAKIFLGECLDLDRRPSALTSTLSAASVFGLTLWLRPAELVAAARRLGLLPEILPMPPSTPLSKIAFDFVAEVA